MQLTAFRIFKYRNIEDSGLVKLTAPLTCIVGKNQSGKTNLLKALQKLNPHDKTIKYDLRSDWPRGGRRTKDETQIVCQAHFDLGSEGRELVDLTESATPPTRVVVTKNYAGEYTVEFPDQDLFPNRVHQDDVDRICGELTVPDALVGDDDTFSRALGECTEEAKRLAHQGRFTELAKLAEPHLEKLERAGSADRPNRGAIPITIHQSAWPDQHRAGRIADYAVQGAGMHH
jgi:energy-coupling factor transporter ATP-binding protein EcfA2